MSTSPKTENNRQGTEFEKYLDLIESSGSPTPASFLGILVDMWQRRQTVFDLREYMYKNSLEKVGVPLDAYLNFLKETKGKLIKSQLSSIRVKDREYKTRLLMDEWKKTLYDCIMDGYIKLSSDKNTLTITDNGRELIGGFYWFELSLQKYKATSGVFVTIFGAAVGTLAAQGILAFFRMVIAAQPVIHSATPK